MSQPNYNGLIETLGTLQRALEEVHTTVGAPPQPEAAQRVQQAYAHNLLVAYLKLLREHMAPYVPDSRSWEMGHVSWELLPGGTWELQVGDDYQVSATAPTPLEAVYALMERAVHDFILAD